MSFSIKSKRARRRDRKRQLKLNTQLKKRLFGHLFIAPCCYCRQVFLINELTIEHLVPRTLGGTNQDSNIALACAPCNHRKGQEAWEIKKCLAKKRYQDEQYSAQYSREDWSSPL